MMIDLMIRFSASIASKCVSKIDLSSSHGLVATTHERAVRIRQEKLGFGRKCLMRRLLAAKATCGMVFMVEIGVHLKISAVPHVKAPAYSVDMKHNSN
jgi:hypothetical protein